MRGSCLTQNGAWFKSQGEEESLVDTEGPREKEREGSATHRGLIYPLSLSTAVFPPLLCFLFCFHCPETDALSRHLFSSSLLPSHRFPLVWLLSGQQHAIIGSHHRRYRAMAARTSRTLGGNFMRRGFNESEASSAGEKCMQMICTRQKDPG